MKSWVIAAGVLGAVAPLRAQAQEPPPKAEAVAPDEMFTAPDGSFDISGFLSTRVGFLPIAMPITEPAVGYGLAIGLSYFHSEPPVVGDPQTGKQRTIMPSTSMVFGAATENNTWAAGAAHLGIWDQGRTRYMGALGYTNLELDWFGRDEALGGRSVAYSNDAAFLMQSIKFQLAGTHVFVGPEYRFIASDATFDVGALDPGIPQPEFESRTSGVGLMVGYDDLDHPYQAARGIKAEVTVREHAEWLGGDFDYAQLRSYLIGYVPIGERFVLGLKGNYDLTGGGAPFYDLSSIDVRGIEKQRYVDDEALYGESELRWDFVPRWSALLFGGGGAVGESLDSLGEAHLAAGVGGRYLIAAKYGLRMGIDFAYGDDEFTVYVGMGTGWVRP